MIYLPIFDQPFKELCGLPLWSPLCIPDFSGITFQFNIYQPGHLPGCSKTSQLLRESTPFIWGCKATLLFLKCSKKFLHFFRVVQRVNVSKMLSVFLKAGAKLRLVLIRGSQNQKKIFDSK